MSIYGAMRTSVSGMAAQADRIATISDNVANTGTAGYKRGLVEFSSLVVATSPAGYESGAVEVAARRAIGQQGVLRATSSPTDLAIEGNGFFAVRGADGELRLTRAGGFRENASGELVNAAGFRLLGYDLSGGAATGGAVNGSAGLVPVTARATSLTAEASRVGRLAVNLPSAAALATTLPSTNSAASSFAAKSSVVAYGKLGEEITLDLYFARTGAGQWEVAAFDRRQAGAGGGFPYGGGPLGTATLAFGPNGALTNAPAARLSITPAGGETIDLDLAASTQLATSFAVAEVEMDGRAPLARSRIEVSDAGVVSAVTDDGNRVSLFRLPMVSVAGTDGLRAVGGEAYATTEASGEMLFGDAGASGRGLVRAGMLEQSNVDLSSELTDMIDAQRSYTANSRVFQTGSELMDVIVNLKR